MIVEGEGAVLRVHMGHPIVTNGDFVVWLCETYALFPNYFGEDLFVNGYVKRLYPSVKVRMTDTECYPLPLMLSYVKYIITAVGSFVFLSHTAWFCAYTLHASFTVTYLQQQYHKIIVF